LGEYAGETFVPSTGDVGEKVGEVGLYLCEAPPLGEVGEAKAGDVGLHRGEAGDVGEAGENEGLVGLNLGEAGENVGLEAPQRPLC